MNKDAIFVKWPNQGLVEIIEVSGQRLDVCILAADVIGIPTHRDEHCRMWPKPQAGLKFYHLVEIKP